VCVGAVRGANLSGETRQAERASDVDAGLMLDGLGVVSTSDEIKNVGPAYDVGGSWIASAGERSEPRRRVVQDEEQERCERERWDVESDEADIDTNNDTNERGETSRGIQKRKGEVRNG
jgi:hypothetical protein